MQFGRVLDATLMMDKDTGRPRGFGFVTFDSEAAVDSTLAQPLEIHGKMIEVKKAQPRGNLQKEDEDRKFGRQKGGFQGNNQSNFVNDQGNQQAQGSNGSNNMSPAMMAQYWQRMQQYFQMMQQNMAAVAQQNSGPNMGAMGGMNQMNPQMNPQMMQQMMAMQQQAQNQQRGGTPGPQSPTAGTPGGMGQMNPQLMNQMMQQGGMNSGFGPGGSGMVSPMNGGPGTRPGFTAQEQLAFEQQKYERQHAQRITQGGYGGGGPGGPTTWEGMYDDVPQPNFPNQSGRGNMGGGGGGYGGRQASPYQGGGGRGNRGQNNTPQPAGGNPSAPANAPTGPKNAGKPGANYRGGGMRGGHRGFHPYARGQ